MQRRFAALLIALSLLAAGHAAAQNYPDRTIRIIVGFTPGSATDISSRMFAQKLSEAWSVPVTVENIPGGGGSVGAERVSKSAPDGYTLYWGANGAMTINPSLLPSPIIRSAARPRADRAAAGVAEHSGGQQRRAGQDASPS